MRSSGIERPEPECEIEFESNWKAYVLITCLGFTMNKMRSGENSRMRMGNVNK